MMSAFDFFWASALMGLGVGIDVAAATFARAPRMKATGVVLLWIFGVTLTHSLFPMLGYLLAYFSVSALPMLTPIIGVLAFACIALYLKSELAGFAQLQQQQAVPDKQLLVTCGIILAVSWDALWSGPAKSAQVVGWPEAWVWLSFAMVGAVVALLAIISLLLARQLGRLFRPKQQTANAARWLSCGVQYTAIAYFGVLALCRYSLNLSWAWWQLLLLSATAIAALMYLSRFKWLQQKRSRQKVHHLGNYRHWPSTMPLNR